MSKYKVAPTRHSVEKDGVRLSTAETAEELQRLAEENMKLKAKTEMSPEVSNKQSSSTMRFARGLPQSIFMGIGLGLVVTLALLNAGSIWGWLWSVIQNGFVAIGYGLAGIFVLAISGAFSYGLWWGLKELYIVKDVPADSR